MRHFFLVHSAITYLVAKRVVSAEGIDPESVRLLLSRRFTPDDDTFRSVAVPYTFKPESFPQQWRLVDSRRRLRELDAFVERVSGGDSFHLYLAQSGQRFIQLLKTHPRCAGFSWLEEGLASYLDDAELEAIEPTRSPSVSDRLGYRGRIGVANFYDPGHDRAYAVSPGAFPGKKRVCVLNDVFPSAAQNAVRDLEWLLACDGLVAHRRLREDSYLKGLERFLQELGELGVEHLHYKAHPAQVAQDRLAPVEACLRRSAARGGPTPVRLPDTTLLECLAFAKPSLRFVVNLSSVAVYAGAAGCRVVSFAPYICDAEPEFSNLIEAAPRAFREAVEFLDPAATLAV